MAFETDLNKYVNDIALGNFQENFVDGNRTNRFIIDFSRLISKFPDKESAKQLETMKFLVTAAPIPGRTSDTVNANWQGMPTAYAGNYSQQTWTTTFLSDINFVAEKFIENWMVLIHDLKTNAKATPDQYKIGCNILAQQLNPAGILVEQTELVNIFPTVKGERNGETGSAEFQTFSVTWAFDYPIKNFNV